MVHPKSCGRPEMQAVTRVLFPAVPFKTKQGTQQLPSLMALSVTVPSMSATEEHRLLLQVHL